MKYQTGKNKGRLIVTLKKALIKDIPLKGFSVFIKN